jgi:hypothetical protein
VLADRLSHSMCETRTCRQGVLSWQSWCCLTVQVTGFFVLSCPCSDDVDDQYTEKGRQLIRKEGEALAAGMRIGEVLAAGELELPGVVPRKKPGAQAHGRRSRVQRSVEPKLGDVPLPAAQQSTRCSSCRPQQLTHMRVYLLGGTISGAPASSGVVCCFVLAAFDCGAAAEHFPWWACQQLTRAC